MKIMQFQCIKNAIIINSKFCTTKSMLAIICAIYMYLDSYSENLENCESNN